MMPEWIPIDYRDFYDFPRLVAFSHEGSWFMLDCSFDDGVDGYPDVYRVLAVRQDDVTLLAKPDWREVVERASYLGDVELASVQFDSTRRKSINGSILAVIGDI